MRNFPIDNPSDFSTENYGCASYQANSLNSNQAMEESKLYSTCLLTEFPLPEEDSATSSGKRETSNLNGYAPQAA
jgi:hypothetical protein